MCQEVSATTVRSKPWIYATITLSALADAAGLINALILKSVLSNANLTKTVTLNAAHLTTAQHRRPVSVENKTTTTVTWTGNASTDRALTTNARLCSLC